MKPRPVEYVDDYISGSAITIDINGTIKEALNLMEKNHTDFLVVTKQDVPVFILKAYQAMLKNPEDNIQSLVDEGKLEAATIVESGSLWSNNVQKLKDTTVLIVADTTHPNPQLRGTISTYDLKIQKR